MNNRFSLFSVSFAAIMATSFCFILRAIVVDDWGVEFALSETQKGELLGVGLWPFAISIVLLSFIIDRIGFKMTFWAAGACHLIGLAILLTASGYWMLYVGTLVMALGNGAVESAANPLIATVFENDRPKWLNRLHAAWPGGMIAGGGLALLLGDAVGWRVKVFLMLAPVLVYVVLLVKMRFPVSQRVASGVSYRAMLGEAGYVSAFIVIALMVTEIARIASLPLAAAVALIALLTALYAIGARSPGKPLFILFVLLMIPLATTELSTDSWIASLMAPEMEAIGLSGGWVLIYTAAIMFVMRLAAGDILKLLSPLGVLAAASALAALGLVLLSTATGMAVLAAATVYGIGKSMFWGTSLAVVSDQFPRGGSVTINMVAGSGMLAAGIIGAVYVGAVQDMSTSRSLRSHDSAYATSYSEQYLSAKEGAFFGSYEALDQARMAAAPADVHNVIEAISADSKKRALRDIAILPVIMITVYVALILHFRRRGGYRPAPLDAG